MQEIYAETVAIQQGWRALELTLCRAGGEQAVEEGTREGTARRLAERDGSGRRGRVQVRAGFPGREAAGLARVFLRYESRARTRLRAASEDSQLTALRTAGEKTSPRQLKYDASRQDSGLG